MKRLVTSAVSRMKNVLFHCKNIIHSHCIALLRCLFWIHKTSSAHAPGSTKGNLSWNNYFKRVSLNSQPCPQPFSLQMCSKYSHNDRGWNDEKILWPEIQLPAISNQKTNPCSIFCRPPYLTTLRELWNCSCNA